MAETRMALVRFEGQEVELEPELAQDDQLIIDALGSWYPMLATARFSRKTEDGRLIVEATKQGGTKGAFIADLDAAPDILHPAVDLMLDFDALDRQGLLTQEIRLERHWDIEAALVAITEQQAQLARFLKLMDQASPIPARIIPLGF